ncbi:MAG: DUF192 domain-containing protein [Halanaeroarchaeum sp.]
MRPIRLLLPVLAIAAGALVLAVGLGVPPVTGPPTGTQVVVSDQQGATLGTVGVSVADTPTERYMGLSNTDPLGPDEGMWFVFDREGDRAFVMRGMAYPLDIVFVGADGRVTAIHHAPVPDGGPLNRYEGRAKWVLEVPEGWTTDHGVAVGDRVAVANQTSVQAK